MCDAIVTHDMLHLNERESAQLARAVQILVQELGFDPEAVDRSYNESMAFFLKKDHVSSDLQRQCALYRADKPRCVMLD